MIARAPILTGLRVLTIEDDPAISRLLQLELEHRGMQVHRAADGIAGLEAVATFRPDVILLDILLPGMDGERILALLRGDGVRTPVIMLTARDRSSDKIRNLDGGADDYLAKPFDIDELLARIRAVLRRATIDTLSRLRVADLEMDRDARLVTRGSAVINLTAREYELLELLMTNARHVLPREMIIERVWGYDAEVDSNILDVYIGYLRRKIDLPGSPRLIRTVRGLGFTLRDD